MSCCRVIAAAVVAVAICSAADGSASADPACIPIARVSGEPALVATVSRALYERGLSLSGPGTCGAVTAEVAPRGEGVWVTITDADGRTVERLADDGEGAATTIESWARRDLVDPLLAAPPEAPRTRPAVRSARTVVRPRAAPPWEITAWGVGAVSDDGAVWSGARAQFAAAVAFLSLGGHVGFSADTGLSGRSGTPCRARDTSTFNWAEAEPGCGTSRTALDFVLSAEVPFALGAWVLAPGLGVGQRTLWASRGFGDADERSDDAAGLLLSAHVSASRAFGRHWALRIGLTGLATPAARARLGATDDLRADPDAVPSLAGVPVAQGLLGIGIAWGGGS